MTSRFGKLIEDAKRPREPEPPAADVEPTHPPAPIDPPAPPKRGRPPGKKSKTRGAPGAAGEFSQVTAYVTTATRRRVDIALAQEALERGTKPREFSELVQELLDGWLAERG